jgi:phosphopantothenoylcysteine decarboxylase/phosphopantothenate--cysteine ligase
MCLKKNILLGVTGGIAAYKAVDLASTLIQAGAHVQTVMTHSACQLIGVKSFQAVTHAPVHTDLWSSSENYTMPHIRLADWADMIVIAPATANIIGKMAGGICDDLLSTLLCTCWQRPLLLAPAMNSRMWHNPRVQHNIQTLTEMGVTLVGPNEGRLACGEEGPGRMAEPEQIIKAIKKICRSSNSEP